MKNGSKLFVDRPAIKFIGWVCTVASLFTGVYFALLYKPSSHFEYEVISKTQILNRNVDVASIHIMIDSLDIRQDSMNISIIEIKVSNTGREHLRREDYDNSTFGLEIVNGKLLEEPEVSSYSSTHILRCFKNHSFDAKDTFVTIPIIPLDSKDNYQIKLVILHHRNKIISFVPHGKIIGQKEIDVLENKKNKELFWRRVFDENIGIHTIRLIVYLVMIIAFIWIIVTIEEKINNKKKQKIEKELIIQFRKNKQIDDEVIDDYQTMRFREFCQMADLMKLLEGDLLHKYKASINYTRNEKNKANEEQWNFHKRRYSLMKKMLEKRYIEIVDDRLKINKKKKISILEIMQKVIDSKLYMSYMYIHDDKKYIIEEEFTV